MRIGNREFLRPVNAPFIEPGGEMYRLWQEIGASYKWHHYYEEYERLVPRDRPLKILEIGVRFGGSLELWQRWMHPDSVVVGIDIEERCARYERENINVRIGDQSDESFLADVVDEFGEFDIIIDDGSHESEHQRVSWQYLFREGLAPGGLYIVEDIYNSYFPETFDEAPFISTCKMLIDLMHMNYYLAASTGPFLSNDPVKDGVNIDMEYYEAWTRRIEFTDGIVVFYKQLRSMPVAPLSLTLDHEEHGIE